MATTRVSKWAAVPKVLTSLRQWVGWRYEEHNGKTTKVPINPSTGTRASTADPQTWSDFETALRASESHKLDGVGFVFTEGDPFVGIDLDGVRDPKTGALDDLARTIVRSMNSYTEVSPSGRGLHIIVQGQLPNGHALARTLSNGRRIELYSQGRYFTVTGDHVPETPREVEDRSSQVESLVQKLVRSTGHRTAEELPPLPDTEIQRRVESLLTRLPRKVQDLWSKVPDRDRSGREYRLACEAVKAGVKDELDLACLVFSSAAHKDKFTNRSDSWKRSVECARKALSVAGEAAGGRKPTQATVLVGLAENVELFHTPDGVPYATVPVGDHKETWPIRSRRFAQWLKRQYYNETQAVPNATALSDALGVLEGRALWDGQEQPVHIRVAGYGGRIYVDLCNSEWEVVEVSREGWQVINDPPVKFTRTDGMLPLPHPVKGNIRHLRPFINVEDEDSWVLVCSWLTMAWRPSGPYPILILQGEQGSSKSTLARVLRALVDPSSAPLRAAPKEERDLLIAARNSWVISLDNLSGTPPWLSDSLCRLATGAGFSTRALYTDTDEVIFAAQRPVILNGIDDLATREDLRDRAIVLQLPPIPSSKRKPEQDFWDELEGLRPAILGGLLDAVSAALRRQDEVLWHELPRMADFARWGAAAARALGWSEEEFVNAYQRNLRQAVEITMDSNLVAGAVRQLVRTAEAHRWQGTASELLLTLNRLVDDELRRGGAWPKAPHALSNQLKRVAPLLRAAGIEVRLGTRVGKSGQRLIQIWGTGRRASEASAATEKVS